MATRKTSHALRKPGKVQGLFVFRGRRQHELKRLAFFWQEQQASARWCEKRLAVADDGGAVGVLLLHGAAVFAQGAL